MLSDPQRRYLISLQSEPRWLEILETLRTFPKLSKRYQRGASHEEQVMAWVWDSATVNAYEGLISILAQRYEEKGQLVKITIDSEPLDKKEM